MPETHKITLQIQINYEGESVDWKRVLEDHIQQIGMESAFTDSPILFQKGCGIEEVAAE